jgi:hypothetical protein
LGECPLAPCQLVEESLAVHDPPAPERFPAFVDLAPDPEGRALAGAVTLFEKAKGFTQNLGGDPYRPEATLS